jgi:nucleotide-binding universal stress UspA family protein
VSIVLGYDESPGAHRALETAIDFAQRFETSLLLVYGAAPPGQLGEEYTDHLQALEEAGRRAAAHAVARARDAGVETEVVIVRASPAEALATVARERDASMIVVGSYGEGPLRGAFLGSTPYKLVHRSPVPVLVVPPHD